MLTAYLKRGVKAGIVAGLVFGLLVTLVANPFVAFADELGHAGDHAADHHEGAGGDGLAASAAVTNAVSVVSGVLWGIFLGGVVFGVVYYFLEPAIPGTGATKSYLLAAAGFVTVSGAPWLVLPPHPPGVEQTLPADTRIALYGGMMLAGALVSLASAFVYGRLRERRARPTAAVAALVPFCLLAIPAVLSPAAPVESSLPPELAAGLTGMVVFGQALLWLLLAGAHAHLGRSSVEEGVAEASGAPTDGALAAD